MLPVEDEIPRAVVLGALAAVTGLTATQTARLVGYDDAQTVIGAAGKLLPVDPVEAATWLAALHPEIDDLVADTAGLTDLDDLPADGVPFVDLLAQRHSTERMRLFHA